MLERIHSYIFFNVYGIFITMAGILIVAVLILAIRHRAKQDAVEGAGPDGNIANDMDMREIGLTTSGMTQVHKPDGSQEIPTKDQG